MGKHLYKENKRRCYVCKQVFPLNGKRFHKSKTESRGFRYECKGCQNTFRARIMLERGLCCEACGLKHSNKAFFDVDHINPSLKTDAERRSSHFSKQSYLIGNYQVLCPNCHRNKTLN